MKPILVAALGAALVAPALAQAQNIASTPSEVAALTSEWTGERLGDGRPKVPDAILDRMMKVGLEEAWAVLRNQGFEWQYEGRFRLVHLDETATMVGRALTATFVPKRPDLDKALTEKGHADGHIGGRNSWPIDMLRKRDVYFANAFSSFEGGPIIGGNLRCWRSCVRSAASATKSNSKSKTARKDATHDGTDWRGYVGSR